MLYEVVICDSIQNCCHWLLHVTQFTVGACDGFQKCKRNTSCNINQCIQHAMVCLHHN